MNSKLQVLVAAALMARPTLGQVGTDLCACQPSTYELTLDFSLVCADTDVGGEGIFDQDCLIATRLPDTVNVTNLVPVTVSEIQILELDQFQDVVGIVIYNEGPYFDGDVVTYTSIVRSTPEFINPVTLPRGFQVSIVGNNADGQPIINTWGILYDNDCGIFPLLIENQKIGWTIFTDLGDPPLDVCPIAPPTDFPTASPVLESGTQSPTDSDTSAPTASPVVTRTEAPVTSPTAPVSPVAPPVSPVAPPVPDITPVETPVAKPTRSPTVSPPTEPLPPVSGKRGGTNYIVQEDEDEEEEEAEEEEKEEEEVEKEQQSEKAVHDNGALEGKRGSTNSGKAKKKSRQDSGKMSKINKSKSGKGGKGKSTSSGKGGSTSSTNGGKAGRTSSTRGGKAGGKAGGKGTDRR